MNQIIRIDENGQILSKTKFTNPYDYDPILLYSDYSESETGAVYSDRLYREDSSKFNQLCTKHFGDQSQYFDSRSPDQIESFLKDFLNQPELKLNKVIEYCNPSSGYPLWGFFYKA